VPVGSSVVHGSWLPPASTRTHPPPTDWHSYHQHSRPITWRWPHTHTIQSSPEDLGSLEKLARVTIFASPVRIPGTFAFALCGHSRCMLALAIQDTFLVSTRIRAYGPRRIPASSQNFPSTHVNHNREGLNMRRHRLVNVPCPFALLCRLGWVPLAPPRLALSHSLRRGPRLIR